MESFKEMIDEYITHYNDFDKGKISFDCEYGELTFIKSNKLDFILYAIYIYPQYREKGLCRQILHYMIDCSTNHFTRVCVQSVLSKVLYEYLLRFTYNNKRFKNTKTGFVYKIT